MTDCKGREIEIIEVGRVTNLIGKIYNQLTVKARVKYTKRVSWLCECSCGNLVIIAGNHLTAGDTKSCGCANQVAGEQKVKRDIIGQTFNELTCLDIVKINNQWKVKCQCSCGNITYVERYNLLNGNTTTCGDSIHKIENHKNQIFGRWQCLDYNSTMNGHTYWNCKCLNCGIIKSVRIDQLTSGNSYSCGCLSQSHGAFKIEEILNKSHIDYKKEFCFKDLKSSNGVNLRFDFAVFKESALIALIEFDGKQHMEPSQYFGGEDAYIKVVEHDKQKNEYCLINNIPLYRIPYTAEKSLTLENLFSKQFLINTEC